MNYNTQTEKNVSNIQLRDLSQDKHHYCEEMNMASAPGVTLVSPPVTILFPGVMTISLLWLLFLTFSLQLCLPSLNP